LDIGCGDGTYALVAAERGAAVTGMDLSEEMLRAARGRILTKGFRVDL
jgi:cyclopropane fatty-acyl-phospholipid synthase-like methyltransferase